jgi:RNA polymerase sigma-70 factor (ECF subfamily)
LDVCFWGKERNIQSGDASPHSKSAGVFSLAGGRTWGKLDTMAANAPNSSETNRLLRGSGHGQSSDWDVLLGRHRDRLRRMVSLRLDGRLRGRVDPSDVLRQAFADAGRRRQEYLDTAAEPFFLWLRRLTGQRLHALHLQRLGETPPPDGELSLQCRAVPATCSLALAAQLLGRLPQPSQAEVRARRMRRLEEALNAMAPLAREVLALRHFEQLDNREAAAILGCPEGEASKLYVRALKELNVILTSLTGPAGEDRP